MHDLSTTKLNSIQHSAAPILCVITPGEAAVVSCGEVFSLFSNTESH